ncbi:MAG: hypothetical protein K8S27_11955 [Candidatus Omnitrophica bacterium]|nr:hypothetical protein [Candidatus Omnitrophota bacterium]
MSRQKVVMMMSLFLCLVLPVPSRAAYDGVYMSSPAQSEVDQEKERKRTMIEGYVQQVVVNTVIKKSGEVIRRTIQNNKIDLFPQLAFQAIQQAAWQVFNQPATRELALDIFESTTNKALLELEEGIDSNLVQQHIQSKVDQDLQALYQDPLFQKIVKKVLELALMDQRKIIVMQVTQQQLRLQVIAQEQEKMKRKIIQEYQKGILSSK